MNEKSEIDLLLSILERTHRIKKESSNKSQIIKFKFFAYNAQKPEAYSEPNQTSKIELFMKIVNDF